MGNVDHIEQLEEYIDVLGEEVERVKKASEYLKMIERFQEDVSKTSAGLLQTKKQLKIHQETVEGKLELFQTSSRNIEARQQSIENGQSVLLKKLEQVTEENLKLNKQLLRWQDNQKAELKKASTERKKFLWAGMAVNLLIGGGVIYLLLV
ncbi:hypothetical protein [Planococcus lenghuensis]|uniref:Uncharacterized protein n=1 Tax=Planococcus lenghuensis TaxID=2213202 RepID=A0A1Q2KVN1_9BACL|nr:hypothetical protein [Planococcus lenghuensis]AQQ52249.1 hypothetical protein B0X71_03395 [Planococcus lenghuensis]